MIVDTITKAVDGPKIGGRLTQLEARLAQLETKPFVKFCGTFQGGKAYRRGTRSCISPPCGFVRRPRQARRVKILSGGSSHSSGEMPDDGPCGGPGRPQHRQR